MVVRVRGVEETGRCRDGGAGEKVEAVEVTVMMDVAVTMAVAVELRPRYNTVYKTRRKKHGARYHTGHTARIITQ